MSDPEQSKRVPVRASIALAGAGSLGTFLSAASRELLLRLHAHNRAVLEQAPNEDGRYLRPDWGLVVIDSVSGTSAGAITACQVVKALFEPSYLCANQSAETRGCLSGDWIHGADFTQLASDHNQPETRGPVSSPGWTLLSGARLYETVFRMLRPTEQTSSLPSLLDETGVVALAITLTDLLGYHEPAEFEAGQVIGHPDFGASPPRGSLLFRGEEGQVRDLGSRGHAEIRKMFIARDGEVVPVLDHYLTGTRRRRRAQIEIWGPDAASRMAAVATASAALPFAVGPVTVQEPESDSSKLYMDGGVLNNKPVAPALLMARWHDAYRVRRTWDASASEFDREKVEATLSYQRVCFFIDAFPDRSFDAWRSQHPDAWTQTWHSVMGVQDDVEERKRRLLSAIETPAGGIGVFFESVMTTLRAQDAKVIAKNNLRLDRRDALVDSWIYEHDGEVGSFVLDTIEKAFAWATVCARPTAARLSKGEKNVLTRRLHDIERMSGLDGRRAVTMVPIFAPRGLRGVFAGEALYALAGLLALDARRYDSSTGSRVARTVLDAIAGRVAERQYPPLPPAPDDAHPDDSSPLVNRIRVAAKALIDGRKSTSSVVRFFARLPLNLDPIMDMARVRLDRKIRGE